MAGAHVARELPLARTTQLLQEALRGRGETGLAAFARRDGHGGVPGDEGHELLDAYRRVLGEDGDDVERVCRGGGAAQDRRDAFRLDAHAAELDLRVDAPHDLERGVRHHPD